VAGLNITVTEIDVQTVGMDITAEGDIIDIGCARLCQPESLSSAHRMNQGPVGPVDYDFHMPPLFQRSFFPAWRSSRPAGQVTVHAIVCDEAGQRIPVSLSVTSAGGTHRPGCPRQGMTGSTGAGNSNTQ
jgi:hypothetical protein